MKISLALILKELQADQIPFLLLAPENQDISAMHLTGICPFDGDTAIQDGVVYLMAPGLNLFDLSLQLKALEKTTSVLIGPECSGSEDQPVRLTYLSMINKEMPDAEVPLWDFSFYHRIFQRIFGIFQKYQSWQENLYLAVENENIQDLLDVSQPIFRKSIYIAGNEGQYLAASGPCLDYLGLESQVPLEIFNALKNETAIEPSLNAQETFIYPAGILNADALCRDLFINNVYFCRIIILDEIEKTGFDSCDYALMLILFTALSLMLRQNRLLAASAGRNAESRQNLIVMLAELIRKLPVDAHQLETVLFRNGWKNNEGCFVGCLLLNPDENQLMNANYYNRYISRHVTGVYPLDYHDHLILIIRESVYPSAEDFLARFNLFIRDGNFRFGISNRCANLIQLPYFKLQAEIAVNEGLRRDVTIWCHKFANLAFSHLLKASCHEMPAELLCAPELLVLKNYDARNKTEYYETLKTYLDHKMIATQTAKALYIHHATMIYRLKRMTELTGINYDDPEKMLYLHLSFRMLEQEGQLLSRQA